MKNRKDIVAEKSTDSNRIGLYNNMQIRRSLEQTNQEDWVSVNHQWNLKQPHKARVRQQRRCLLTSNSGNSFSLDITKIKVLSYNLTLIRAINNDMHAKEIYRIVHDIQQITSVFVAISFSHFRLDQNVDADLLAKRTLASVSVASALVG